MTKQPVASGPRCLAHEALFIELLVRRIGEFGFGAVKWLEDTDAPDKRAVVDFSDGPHAIAADNRDSLTIREEKPLMPPPHPLYQAKPRMPLFVDPDLYGPLGQEVARRTLVTRIDVPARAGKAWEVRADRICCNLLPECPQVAGFNIWNLHNPREPFRSGRTKQLHSAHLTTFDRFWSCLPWLRPIATITNETVQLRYR